MEEDRAMFDILNFEPIENSKENNGKFPFDCTTVGKKDPRILEIARKLCVCSNEGEQPSINLHEASVFAAHFGVPKDVIQRVKWKKMSWNEKVASIKNKLTESGTTSFTKIL